MKFKLGESVENGLIGILDYDPNIKKAIKRFLVDHKSDHGQSNIDLKKAIFDVVEHKTIKVKECPENITVKSCGSGFPHITLYGDRTSCNFNSFDFCENPNNIIKIDMRSAKQKEKDRERLRLKYLHIDPYGEDEWENEAILSKDTSHPMFKLLVGGAVIFDGSEQMKEIANVLNKMGFNVYNYERIMSEDDTGYFCSFVWDWDSDYFVRCPLSIDSGKENLHRIFQLKLDKDKIYDYKQFIKITKNVNIKRIENPEQDPYGEEDWGWEKEAYKTFDQTTVTRKISPEDLSKNAGHISRFLKNKLIGKTASFSVFDVHHHGTIQIQDWTVDDLYTDHHHRVHIIAHEDNKRKSDFYLHTGMDIKYEEEGTYDYDDFSHIQEITNFKPKIKWKTNESMAKEKYTAEDFFVGQRVRGISFKVGEGTVLYVDKLSDDIGVEFDKEIGGHNCSNRGKEGHCWCCTSAEIVPLEKKEDISKKSRIKWYDKGRFSDWEEIS